MPSIPQFHVRGRDTGYYATCTVVSAFAHLAGSWCTAGMVGLATEEQFFRENEARLSERFAGKVLVIHGCRVVAVYESQSIAEREATREFGAQTILLKAIERRSRARSAFR